ISRPELLDLYRCLGRNADVVLRFSSGLFEILTTGLQVQEISNVSLATPLRTRITGANAVLKAAVDYLAAAAGLVLLTPVLLVLAVLVRLDSPGPVLHRRRVLGVSGKTFDAFKFRTMVINADAVLAQDARLWAAFTVNHKLKDDPRVTRVGRILR